MRERPLCVIMGFGPGNGAAIARKFADEGFALALVSRTTEFSKAFAAEWPEARAYACDVTDASAMQAVIASIREDLGAIDTLIYNPNSFLWANLEDTTAEDMERVWKINVLGLFHAAKLITPEMKERGSGTILVTGGPASRRGIEMTTAYGQAKSGQRVLCQSLARGLWPHGIHVAIVVIDGVVDLPRTRKSFADKPLEEFIRPAGIAQTLWSLSQQPPSAWTFECEVRSYKNDWT